MSDLPDLGAVCVKCGRSWQRLLVLAMLVDAGARVSPSPLDCDHSFEEDIRESALP